jgi:hypothetical protein
MSISTNPHVSFSQYNTVYPAESGAAPMYQLAPSDQMQESFNLEEFEHTIPSSPSRSGDVLEQVSGLIEKNHSYKSREQQVIRFARMKQRESSNLKVSLKSKTFLMRAKQRKLAAQMDDLIKKNQKFAQHSNECKQVLVKWKEKEKSLQGVIAVKDHTIQTLRTQISSLTQQNADLLKQQQTLLEEKSQFLVQATEITRERDLLLAQRHLLDQKDKDLNGIRETMQIQLEKIIQMGTSSQL